MHLASVRTLHQPEWLLVPLVSKRVRNALHTLVAPLTANSCQRYRSRFVVCRLPPAEMVCREEQTVMMLVSVWLTGGRVHLKDKQRSSLTNIQAAFESVTLSR